MTPDGKATTALDVVEAGWRALLPVGAEAEKQLTADLDGDGADEVIVLSSKVDAVSSYCHGLSAGESKGDGDLAVQVFAQRGDRMVELGRVELVGGAQLMRVARLRGDGKRKMVVVSAAQCSGGIELHVIGIRDRRIQQFLERDYVDGGKITISRDGTLVVREMVYAGDDLLEPWGYRTTRYRVQGDALVAGSQRHEPFARKVRPIGPSGRARAELWRIPPDAQIVGIQAEIAKGSEHDQHVELCRGFVLTDSQIRTFLTRARVISGREEHDYFEWAPCLVGGTLKWPGGHARFEINAALVGSVFLEDGRHLRLGCDGRCEKRVYP